MSRSWVGVTFDTTGPLGPIATLNSLEVTNQPRAFTNLVSLGHGSRSIEHAIAAGHIGRRPGTDNLCVTAEGKAALIDALCDGEAA